MEIGTSGELCLQCRVSVGRVLEGNCFPRAQPGFKAQPTCMHVAPLKSPGLLLGVDSATFQV